MIGATHAESVEESLVSRPNKIDSKRNCAILSARKRFITHRAHAQRTTHRGNDAVKSRRSLPNELAANIPSMIPKSALATRFNGSTVCHLARMSLLVSMTMCMVSSTYAVLEPSPFLPRLHFHKVKLNNNVYISEMGTGY